MQMLLKCVDNTQSTNMFEKKNNNMFSLNYVFRKKQNAVLLNLNLKIQIKMNSKKTDE